MALPTYNIKFFDNLDDLMKFSKSKECKRITSIKIEYEEG